jgi:hypothetical protein
MMSEVETRKYIDHNIKKYVYFLETLKILETLVHPETNFYSRKIGSNKSNYGQRRNIMMLTKQMYAVLRMMERMNEHDEVILGFKRNNIFELLERIGKEYIKDYYKQTTKDQLARYLINAGVIEWRP